MYERQIGGWAFVFLAAAAAGQIAFVLLYLTFPWWKTFLGRALFLTALGFAAVLGASVASYLWDWSFESRMFVAFYFVLAIAVWVQIVAFLKVDRDGRVSRNRVNADG